MKHKADWDHENNGLAHAYHTHETAPILFGTQDGVLLYRDHDLRILTWGQVLEIMEPVLAERAKRRDQERRKTEGHAILRKKLPAQRKLKAVLALIDQPTRAANRQLIRPDVTMGIAYVRAMTGWTIRSLPGVPPSPTTLKRPPSARRTGTGTPVVGTRAGTEPS